MTAEQYTKWTAPFRGKRARLVPLTDRALTAVTYLCYPALIAWQWYTGGGIPWRELWVPASWLVIVTLLRSLIDRPRPYEQLDISPLIRKETKGHSFPSRHAFSVFVIAMTGWAVWPLLGGLLTVVGVLLCFIRVLGGVHYPLDVAVGAAVGTVAGLVGYGLI
ncbi:MAG: phosphatase PAP2 family protein [Clostridia bacterium]|nr:phosphatase PAP2 family protein [Clostridia bacterium]